MSKRKTPQNEAFACSKRLSIIENVLAVLSCVYSLIPEFHVTNSNVNFWSNVLFIIVTYLVIFFKDNNFSIGTKQRIEFFLDNSFNRTRTVINSKSYYDNNEVKTGIKRVLANIHENTLYTWEITKVMCRFYIFGTMILVLILLIVFHENKDNVTLILLNFMFSGNFISKTVSVFQLSKGCKELFDEANMICSRYKEIGENFSKVESDVIGLLSKYESLIADTKVNLWEWTFNMKNKKLTEQWQNHKAFFEVYKE